MRLLVPIIKTNPMLYTPPTDFGKHAQMIAARSRRTRKHILLTIGVVLIAGAFIFALKQSNLFGSGNSGKKSGMISGIDKQESPADKISIIQKWDMPAELKEISGICFIDEQRVACIQDEIATVYIYNIKTKSIEKEINFGQPGDYEEVTLVGKAVWILDAQGSLIEIADINAATPVVNQYETFLTSQQDCEGLCYDSAGNRLLVIVKEKDPNSKTYKGIYAFDLKSNTLQKEPAFRINLDDVILQQSNDLNSKKKTNEVKPSAIAIQPGSLDFYITDGPRSRLLILDKNGQVKKLVQLDSKLFAQPEGIAFNKKGELFISNEGPKDPGNILKIDIKP